MKIYRLIIDFEFTWLDNKVTQDNEIISMSIINIDTKKKWNYIFDTKKENELWSFLINWISRKDQLWKKKFSDSIFMDILFEYCKDKNWKFEFNEKEDKLILYWFWISTDKMMLEKYIKNFEKTITKDYKDIQDLIRISNCKDIRWVDIEFSMAMNWCSIETTYFLLTWKKIKSHSWTYEIEALLELFKKCDIENVDTTKFYEYVPFWVFKWMKIKDYAFLYERNAFWYMSSNDDRFSDSISEYMYPEY